MEYDTSKISDDFIEETAFTRKSNKNNEISLSPNRPGLLVSSTSWTKDEDFSILLEALEKYEDSALSSNHYPPLICVITGKGPLKSFYLDLISKRKWEVVKIITPWLENEDYPRLLGAADLGVCLHYSSSGLDLPMKVVDMFGCGLPVCAINFKWYEKSTILFYRTHFNVSFIDFSLGELLVNEKNGFTFKNSTELSSHLLNWFNKHPDDPRASMAREILREKIYENVRKFQDIRWHENWMKNAWPFFE